MRLVHPNKHRVLTTWDGACCQGFLDYHALISLLSATAAAGHNSEPPARPRRFEPQEGAEHLGPT